MSVDIENAAPLYRLVDDIPEVAEARLTVRAEAELLLESRRRGENMGSGISELLPIDALSTAYHVIAAENTHGPHSSERAERWGGLVLDCRRMAAEWYRKLRPEYFDPLRHAWNPDADSFFSHGLSIRQMTENAIVPMPDDPEDEARRINERIEDATLPLMRELGALAVGQSILTVSLCPDKVLADYYADLRKGERHGRYKGCVPEIAKAVFRKMWLDGEQGDRLEEQLAVPGTYFTPYILQKALSLRGLDVGDMDKTQLHGAQIIIEEDLVEGFMPLLDEVASKEWCVNIFMGEVVPDDFVKDYAGFRNEARQRQDSLSDLTETTATFVLDLANDGVDRREALVLVEEFVKMQLLNLGKEDYVVAAQMFDTETVQGLQEVAYLESKGLYDEAFARMEEVRRNAPGGGYCGAGSCGLEAVNMHSEDGKSLAEKLHAEPGDLIVRDNVRTCKCGSKKVAYAYNKNKVNKYCEKCERFESNVNGRKVA